MKRFLCLVGLCLTACAVGTATASAGPIGGPFSGSGTVQIDDGLGGSQCDVDVDAITNDNAINSVSFFNCRGVAGIPQADGLPWAISWSGSTGTFNLGLSITVLGARCRYVKTAASIVYTWPPHKLRVSETLTRIAGGFPCPTSIRVIREITW